MKQNYPKIISACCFLFLFVNVGMPSTSFSVYQPYLVQLVGDSGGALVLSVRTLADPYACPVHAPPYLTPAQPRPALVFPHHRPNSTS